MDPKELGCEGVDWTFLAQHNVWWWALVNAVRYILIP